MMKNDNFVEVPFEAISFKEDLDSLTTVRNHCPWLNETDRLVVMLIVDTMMVLMMMKVMSIMMMKKNWYQYLCRVTTSRPRLLLITGEPDCARAQFNRNPPRLFFIANQSQMVTLLHHLFRNYLYNVHCTAWCKLYHPCTMCMSFVPFHLLCPSSQTSNTLIWSNLLEFVDTHPWFFFLPSWIKPTPTPTDSSIT